MANNYFIAVDFDGTLCENRFPEIGEPRSSVIAELEYTIKHKKALGYTPIIILWTCRKDLPERNYLSEALQWCIDHDIQIHFANENPLSPFGDLTRKIFANEYWDDRARTV